MKEISLIIPTYNEAENMPLLIKELNNVLKTISSNFVIIAVDDNSPDGTGKILDNLAKEYPLKVIHRKGKLGLSSAVIEGFNAVDSKITGVMDADFSHPPDIIPKMIDKIRNYNADFVLGSRYVRGGKIENWTFFRKVVSWTAIQIAKPIAKVKDPMSGFFFFKRKILKDASLSPTGFKIALEILVKANPENSMEVPITFHNRKFGKSKMSGKEVTNYLYHCMNLYFFKFRRFISFCFVGLSGVFVNTFFLWLFTSVFGIYYLLSGLFATEIAILNNFLLNDAFTWKSEAKKGAKQKIKRFFLFNLFSTGGKIIALSILFLLTNYLNLYYLFSNFVGILAATFWNFYMNDRITWKRKRNE